MKISKSRIIWLAYFIPALLVEFIAWWLVPVVCMFVHREYRMDTVKRLNKAAVVLPRDNLVPWLNLFNTHDNNSDEGWYGAYKVTSLIPFLTKYLATVTQQTYDNSKIIRWYYRVWWLQRNCAYGWHYWLFSMPVEASIVIEKGIKGKVGFERFTTRPSSFQTQTIKKLWFGYANDKNIGWKEHTNKPRLLYANRLIGLRKQ